MKTLIAKTRNTRGFENLKEILGVELGTLLYEIINAADRADKELDIVHACLTDLYNADINFKRIKRALDEIERIPVQPSISPEGVKVTDEDKGHGKCVRCKQSWATTDYNGHGHWVCDHCDRMLEAEFEDEYR